MITIKLPEYFELPKYYLFTPNPRILRGGKISYFNTNLPSLLCVYIMVDEYTRVRYVGVTCDFKERMLGHYADGKIFKDIYVLECENYQDALFYESLYIWHYTPPLNAKKENHIQSKEEIEILRREMDKVRW